MHVVRILNLIKQDVSNVFGCLEMCCLRISDLKSKPDGVQVQDLSSRLDCLLVVRARMQISVFLDVLAMVLQQSSLRVYMCVYAHNAHID